MLHNIHQPSNQGTNQTTQPNLTNQATSQPTQPNLTNQPTNQL